MISWFQSFAFTWVNLWGRYVEDYETAASHYRLLQGDYKADKVSLYKSNPIQHELERAWFHPLNLKRYFLVSFFAHEFKPCTATTRHGGAWARCRRRWGKRW